MRLALDTNRYTDLVRGDPDVQQVVVDSDEVCLPLIVIAELRAGFRGGNREAANESILQAFLAKPGVKALLPDLQTTFQYAALDVELRRKGLKIPNNDLWIAALTLQHGLTLFTRDSHFDKIPKILRV